MPRARWHTKPFEQVSCQDCDYVDGDPGGMGRAAQHHDRIGHVVRVEQSFVHYYGEDRPKQRRWWKQP